MKRTILIYLALLAFFGSGIFLAIKWGQRLPAPRADLAARGAGRGNIPGETEQAVLDVENEGGVIAIKKIFAGGKLERRPRGG